MSASLWSLPAALCTLALASACAGGTGADGDTLSRDSYPEGPYGTAEGDVLEDHAFITPDGETLSLDAVFSDESNRLLLISTAAGWCTACREEQGALQELQDDHREQGLYVLVSIFEDNNATPADTDFAAAWIEQYDLDLTVVIDEPFVLSAYYDETLTPMNMMVDVDTMEILRISTGWDPTAVQAIIDARL